MSDVERPLYENFVVVLCFLTSSDDKRRRNKTARILPHTGMHPLNSTFQISDKLMRKKSGIVLLLTPSPCSPPSTVSKEAPGGFSLHNCHSHLTFPLFLVIYPFLEHHNWYLVIAVFARKAAPMSELNTCFKNQFLSSSKISSMSPSSVFSLRTIEMIGYSYEMQST